MQMKLQLSRVDQGLKFGMILSPTSILFQASSQGYDETAPSHLLPYCEGSAKTVHLNRLVLAFSSRICDEY